MFAENLKKETFDVPGIASFLNVWLTFDLLPEKHQKMLNRYYHSYKHHFGRYAQYYYNEQTRELIEKVGEFKDPKILEVGCGCGTESLWLSYKYKANITAVDVNNERLETARARKRLMEKIAGKELVCSFLNQSVLDVSGNFHVVWMEQAFHHLEPRERVIDKLSSLLSPGGYIIISEANAYNPLLQASLFRKRGFNTIRTYKDGKGEEHLYGVERLITGKILADSFRKRGIRKESLRYFRLFPNRSLADRLMPLERVVPMFLKIFFTHYNYVGRKAINRHQQE